MTPYEVISRKRDGKNLTSEEIRYFISAFMEDEITDYQMTSLLMAIYLRGMDYRETSALTNAYIQSGVRIDLTDIPGIKVDKHSTGGVGDKVSLILAPLVACLGVPVPMVSGRGLGHSGGTLDKLESIPGFKTNLSIERFRELLREHGLGLIGQTRELVPADKRIYALRDVTATVDCIPLIAASIMSKKIAEGIDALVLDVKFGNGAFMKNPDDAARLANTLIQIGGDFGRKIVASLTSMEQPLGNYIGNWLEVLESLTCLKGEGPEDLLEVTLNLAGHMLILGGVAKDMSDAKRQCRMALTNGRAMEKFMQIAHAQGADVSFLEHPEKYPQAQEIHKLKSEQNGIVSHMDTYEIGMASVNLGAGRLRAEDSVDPRAGVVLHKKIGDTVAGGDILLTIHTNKPERVKPVLQQLRRAIKITDAAPIIPPLILKELNTH